tara:strand:+ start:313 stop:585 length:273 start_codon:yes stop_codon:yes gene_type:complete
MINNKKDISAILNLLQVVVLVVGLGGIFIQVGHSNATILHNTSELTDLKEIVQDLTKSQIESVSSDSKHAAEINALRNRIDRLEDVNSTN